ncbi:MAG: hypothetical protein AAF557_02785 [Pseudomonadota bacterium]
MTWKNLGIEACEHIKGLFLDLVDSAFRPTNAWLNRSDHWQIDFNFEDATILGEPHIE